MIRTLRAGCNAVRTPGLMLLGCAFYAQLAAGSSLDAITPNWPQANLTAQFDPAGMMQVEQGSNLQVRIDSDQEASVLLVLVDSESKAQVFKPHHSGSGDRIYRGTEMTYPDLLSGETLYANLPEGKATLYVLATRDALSVSAENSTRRAVEDVATQLRESMNSAGHTQVAVLKLPIYVKSPAMKELVTSDEFVQFYTVRTRGVSDPKRSFPIKFTSGSADLTEWGRKQLNEVAQGMSDRQLSRCSFMIEGHTDDVGTDDYNLGLSDRRAKTVSSYLSARGVEANRMVKAAKGKSDPAVSGTDEPARAENRRVVIKRLDSASAGACVNGN